jgi:hypothetical protein
MCTFYVDLFCYVELVNGVAIHFTRVWDAVSLQCLDKRAFSCQLFSRPGPETVFVESSDDLI